MKIKHLITSIIMVVMTLAASAQMTIPGTKITYDIDADDWKFLKTIDVDKNTTVYLFSYKAELLVDADGETPLVGYDTDTAIRSGVLLGLIGEIKGYITRLNDMHPNLTVFMTGGDSQRLLPHLEGMNIIYQEHLAAIGLNRILSYNQANGTI